MDRSYRSFTLHIIDISRQVYSRSCTQPLTTEGEEQDDLLLYIYRSWYGEMCSGLQPKWSRAKRALLDIFQPTVNAWPTSLQFAVCTARHLYMLYFVAYISTCDNWVYHINALGWRILPPPCPEMLDGRHISGQSGMLVRMYNTRYMYTTVLLIRST